MEPLLRITARNVTLDPPTEALLRDEAEKLRQFYDRHLTCHALVEAEHRFATGELIAYAVRLDLKVPGGELVVTHQAERELWTAIQRVFDAARRQLQDYVARLRSTGQGRTGQPRGRVVRLFPYEGYGFLQDDQGEEIYFHKNSVLDGRFEQLEVGAEVRYTEESGEKGPQASSVSLVGKRRRASA